MKARLYFIITPLQIKIMPETQYQQLEQIEESTPHLVDLNPWLAKTPLSLLLLYDITFCQYT